EDVSYIWENYFYEDEDINEYKLTIFCRQQESSLYEKIEEVHYQRAYMLPRIRELLEEAGLSTTDCFTGEGEEPREDSERIFIIAKRREDKS
ncbi:MAG: class I SAM-dependent methyltransferase, partial [Eubacterium sp.]|nr:class I SAM-dependent methyltransferase [Eubacterium sp.]